MVPCSRKLLRHAIEREETSAPEVLVTPSPMQIREENQRCREAQNSDPVVMLIKARTLRYVLVMVSPREMSAVKERFIKQPVFSCVAGFLCLTIIVMLRASPAHPRRNAIADSSILRKGRLQERLHSSE